MNKLRAYGESLEIIRAGEYQNGRAALEAVVQGTGEPYARLTVNIPEAELDDDEVCVKDWSENAELAAAVLEQTDLFEDTGRRVPTGFVQAPVWRIVGDIDG